MNERLKELAVRAGLHIANNSEGRALVFGNHVDDNDVPLYALDEVTK
jgi:hypothetical protein